MYEVNGFEFEEDDFAGAVAEVVGDADASDCVSALGIEWGEVVGAAFDAARREGMDLQASHLSDAVPQERRAEFIAALT